MKKFAWLAAGLTILGQIVWVLVDGDVRLFLTIATVLNFWLATISEVVTLRGVRAAVNYAGLTLAFGWSVEAVGTITGFPFGSYEYTDALGPQLGPVPILIAFAWSMMAYPCWHVSERLTSRLWQRVLISAWLLGSWDLFLDPQMVGEGYWKWSEVDTTLLGIEGIPLSNFVGWWAVSLVLMAALSLLEPRAESVAWSWRPSFALLSWVYFSGTFAAFVFFDRLPVGVIGGLAMGAVVIPWWRKVWQASR